MNLKRKILLLIGLVMSALAVVLAFSSYFISIKSFDTIEEGVVHRNFKRVVSCVQGRMDYLTRIAADWAQWDDTYEFAKGSNPGFVQQNLQFDAIRNLGLDFIALCDSSGKLIFGGYFNLKTGACEKLPKDLENWFTYELLASDKAKMDEVKAKGILNVDGTPAFIVAVPILTSEKKGPPAGILLFGQLLDGGAVSDISGIIGFETAFITEKGDFSSPEFRPSLEKMPKGGIFLMEKLGISEIDGLVLFNDIRGKPSFLVKIMIPRTIHREGLRSILGILGLTTVSMIVFYFILVYMLEKSLFSGLKALVGELRNIHSIEDLSLRVSIQSGSKELFFLSKTINDMIESIQVSQTRAKISEENRERLEKFFKHVVEQAPCGIATCFLDERMKTVNRKYCEIIGYTEEEVFAGLDFDKITPPEDREIQREKIRKLIRTREPITYEKRYIRKDGSIASVLVTSSYFHDETGGPDFLIGTFTDLTERNRIIKEEMDLKDQMMRSQKLDSLGRVAGGFAHDLNNLLVPIIGFTEILLKSKNLDENFRKDLGEIKKAADRAKAMSKKLLALSSIQPMQASMVNINELIRSYMSIIKTMKGEDSRLVLELAGGMMPICADPSIMEQIIVNLVVNSKEAMPSGGTLTMRTFQTTIERDEPGFIFPVDKGEYVVLSIEDTGVGIAPMNLDHVFEPFFTTKKSGGGAGLGLSVVYGAVKEHGGNLRIESVENKGTKVQVYFPARGSAEILSESAILRRIETFDFSSLKIMVVEDEDVVREMVASGLAEAGCGVFSAANSEDAISKFSGDASFRLLVTDVVMPGLNGKKLYDKLKEANPELKVIYMSGYAMDIISRYDVRSLDNFIQKPFSIDELLSKIVSVMEAAPSEPAAQ